MSFPTIPNVEPTIDLTSGESVNLLVASVAFEELGLAHLINSEAEKLQYVLGTIEGQEPLETAPTVQELLQVNDSIGRTMRDTLKMEMMLQMKLEDAVNLDTTTTNTDEPDQGENG
jgi:hypothetical protein